MTSEALPGYCTVTEVREGAEYRCDYRDGEHPFDHNFVIPVPAVPAEPEPTEVDFRAMLGDDSRRWSVQRQLADTLGRPYLATQLAQLLPPDVATRLVQRVDQLLGPEIERRVSAYVAQLQDDVDRATAETLARLAQAADQKREELHRERFGTPSRLA